MTHDALISAVDAAAILNISIKTLREHVKDGTLPRIVTGRGQKRKHYAFDPDDLETFKRARKEFGSRPCLSTSRKSRRTTPSTSSSTVVAFSVLRAEREKAKPKR